MRNCILWATGDDYNYFYNFIALQQYMGRLNIIAAVTKRENIYGKYLDNIPVICASEVKNQEFEYIIVCSRRFFDEICDEIVRGGGIARSRVINASVFCYARFDFEKYISLIERPVTIISDDCWGGEIYHSLLLPFSSPTINIAWDKSEYAKFISDLPYYLRQPLKCEREGRFNTGEHPIGSLGENERKVKMELIHNLSFDEAKEQWDRRKERINFDNIFVKFAFDETNDWQECMRVFDALEYKKICFFPSPQSKSGYINAGFYKRWVRWNVLKQRVVSYRIEDYIRDTRCTHSAIDVLSLLNGEKDYFRDSD